jgi:phosphohistidine phosphatase
MTVLIVRHGDALQSKGADGDRILSAEGRAQCVALGQALSAAGLHLDRVWSSPLVRAVQTAERTCFGLGYAGLIEVDRALVPEGDVERVVQLCGHQGSVAIFSHEPFVRQLCARLLGQSSYPAFRTAEAVWIEDRRVKQVFTV